MSPTYNELKISLVMPVYDPPIERLKGCIDSLKNQTQQGFELIIVDDGSNDEVRQVLESAKSELAESQVEVFLRSHVGVSDARNFGINHASGDYIGFLDCDDQLPPHTLERVLQLVSEFQQPDLILGYVQYIKAESDKTDVSHGPIYCGEQELLTELYRYHLTGSSGRIRINLDTRTVLKIGPVARFVKVDLARECLFPIDVQVSEDTLWSLELFCKAKSVVVTEEVWYWYWTGHSSTTRDYQEDAIKYAQQVLSALPAYVGENTPANDREILVRILGEINRVIRTNFIYDESKFSRSEKRSAIDGLLEHGAIRKYVSLSKAIKAGPKVLIKYALIKTGLAETYWKMKLSSE